MTDREKELFDSIVHGLRSKGWSKVDAEDEALSKIERLRQRKEEQ